MTIKTDKEAICQNCQRKVLAGELMTADTQAAIDTQAGVCSKCIPVIAPKVEAEKVKAK